MRSSYSSGAHPRGTSWAINSPSPIVNSALSAVRPEKRFSSPAWSRFCHGRIWPLSSSRFILAGQWPTALSAGDHAAYSLHAALVQPERRCHGRCPVRNRLHAPVCPIILDSAPAGSHHHHEFPPPARAASTGPSIVQDHQSLAGRSRRHDDL